MSWQKRSVQFILGFPLALPIVSYAVNIGETYVQSGQNQPLNATINVTDVDPKAFSVSVANPEMYKQLGLSADQQVKAKFIPTSSNGGKIILTTKAPVVAPFTDVVLNIDNKGEKNLLPKTLLMPLNGKSTRTQKPSTPVEMPEENVTVTHQAPINLPQTSSPIVVPPEPSAITPAPTVRTKPTVNLPATQSPPTPASPVGYGTDGSLGRPSLSGSSSINTDDSTAAQTKSVEKPLETSDNKKTSSSKKLSSTPAVETNAAPTATTTYVVQRNDNLWTIANHIATKNKTSPQKVMQDIMAANPSVFENGDATRIDANTSLNIPKYKVMPSQVGIKAAKKLRQQNTSTTIKTTSNKAKSNKSKLTNKPPSKRALRRAKYSMNKNGPVRTSHKTVMTIVVPSRTSTSAQGASRSENNNVSRNTAPQLLEQVKHQREATAQRASKVNQLNSSLQSSEQRIKLQNEKLALLERRLKELNGK